MKDMDSINQEEPQIFFSINEFEHDDGKVEINIHNLSTDTLQKLADFLDVEIENIGRKDRCIEIPKDKIKELTFFKK